MPICPETGSPNDVFAALGGLRGTCQLAHPGILRVIGDDPFRAIEHLGFVGGIVRHTAMPVQVVRGDVRDRRAIEL